MKTHLTTITKVSAKSIFRVSIFSIPGIILSIACIILSIYLLYFSGVYVDSGNGRLAAHGGSAVSFFVLAVEFFKFLLTDPFPAILLLYSIVGFYIYFTLATKYALSAAFSDVWKNNLSDWFFNKMNTYVQKITSEGRTIGKLDAKATNQIRLIQAVKGDKTTSKWQRRLIVFILKKVQLNDTDFTNSETKLSTVIQDKIKAVAEEQTTPSKKLIYIAFIVHFILLVLAIILNR